MSYLRNDAVKARLRWVLLSILCGMLSGISSALFLHALDWATKTRQAHTAIIWLLPLAGSFIGWVYHRYGRDVVGGNNLIIDEIHDPKKTVPFRMAPFILGGTILTHLFGGSAGREGTAVQMGASLSDQLSRIFKIEQDERKILLMAGAGAGFGAAIGAPWAGAIFGMEVIYVRHFRLHAWFECLTASFVAFHTAMILHAPHTIYPTIAIPSFGFSLLAYALLAGGIFGLAAGAFTTAAHFFEKTMSRLVRYPPLKPFFGGLLVVALYSFEGSYKFAGLGLESIQSALLQPASFTDSFLKAVFTVLTVGSGFKGGEFIPLVFIGSTLGSALSTVLPVSVGLLSALGFAAVFGAAANAPIACTLMAMEIFGASIGPYAFVACFAAYAVSNKRGIYKSQALKIN